MIIRSLIKPVLTTPLRNVMTGKRNQQLLSDVVSGVVFELDSTLASSYPGTGTSLLNVTPTPADGSAKTAYNFTITGATFNGSAGSPGAYFGFDGTDWFTITSGNTQFLLDLHKSTGGQSHTFIFCGSLIAEAGATNQAFCGTSGADSVQHGLTHFSGLSFSQTDRYALGRSTGSGAVNTGVASSITADGTDKLVVVTLNPVSRAIKIYVNSTTPTNGTAGAYTDTTNATRTFQIGAAGNNVFPFKTGGELQAFAMLNKIVSDAEVATIAALYEARHGINYIP